MTLAPPVQRSASDPHLLDYRLERTFEILLTAASGEKLTPQSNEEFVRGCADTDEVVIEVVPSRRRQTVLGIGSSFTEAAAFVLAHLDSARRDDVMQHLFGELGANFSMARMPIGSCDFCVEGRYSYAPVPHDTGLRHFSINVDCDGFDPAIYHGIRDAGFDLLPMIKQALDIKRNQRDSSLHLMASAWTAPPWMKDNADWFSPPQQQNDFAGSGGRLRADHYATYAAYLDRYLTAYHEQGIDIWAITPVNEPLGNKGQWESMHFSAESQNEFIKHHLGPRLRQGANRDVAILMFDHNRRELEHWCQTILGDSETRDFVAGSAVHWYDSSYRVYEEIFDRVHARFSDKLIIHSEGCIDNLGVDAPEGVLDPAGYKEADWFGNDDFWWHDNATDYAYSATWPGIDADDHPAYAPVHRYARDIIVGLNHWVAGWIDWNCVLDRRGGPNHVGNYCGAPIMIDTATGQVYYTPVYFVLAQLSRAIRPGDAVLEVTVAGGDLDEGRVHACATLGQDNMVSLQVLNLGSSQLNYRLQVGAHYASLTIAPNALQTVRWRLGAVNDALL